MQLSAVQAAALLLGLAVMGVLGTMNGLSAAHSVSDQNRLNEVATSVAEAVAGNAKSGGSVTADTYTITDARLGTVTVTVASTASVVTVSASANGISQQVQAEVQ